MPPGRINGSAGSSSSYPCIAARNYQLTNLSLPLYNDDAHSIDKVFYPLDALRETYTEHKVLAILQCPCHKCIEDKNCFRRPVELETCAQKIVEDYPDGIRTFALLISVDHPLLVLGFAQRAHGSIVRPSSVSNDHLLERYWPGYHRQDPHAFNTAVQQFQSWKYQFEAPILDFMEYTRLERQEILPFANERSIGNGNYGVVYKVDIPEHHCQKFPDTAKLVRTTVVKGVRQHNCVSFACKQFTPQNRASFWKEVDNLWKVRKELQGAHIVSILKAYRRGDTFSILFPYADMSLQQFLDEKANAQRGGPLERDEVWSQLLGITEALRNIAGRLGKRTPDPGNMVTRSWVGCHFDLKPANILVFGDGVWKIADFGQAAFKERQGTGSDVTNDGGSDAYSAPERDKVDKVGPRYDVWSLGCIFLEVTAFLAVGRDGPYGRNDLMTKRQTQPEGLNGTNSRLWEQRQSDSAYVVKPAIETFMSGLANRSPLNTSRGTFSRSIMGLIRQMLSPQPASRRDANGVVRELRHLLETTRQPAEAEPVQSQMDRYERPRGRDVLSGSSFWHLQSTAHQAAAQTSTSSMEQTNTRDDNDEPGNVRMYLYENDHDNIRVDCVTRRGSNGIAASRSRDVRESTSMFVPVYAFSIILHEYEDQPHFYLSSLKDLPEPQRGERRSSLIIQGLKFAVSLNNDQPVDAIAAQSAFTKQQVLGYRSFELESYNVQPFVTWTRKKFNKLKDVMQHRQDSSSALELSETPDSNLPEVQQPSNSRGCMMQIWREDLTDRPDRARIRRIVIFDRDHTIFLLPMHKFFRHEENTSADTVLFLPTKPKEQPMFHGATLHPRRSFPDNEKHIAFAGIPLDPDELRKYERSRPQAREYSKVELKFKLPEDALSFRTIYHDEKVDFRAERRKYGELE